MPTENNPLYSKTTHGIVEAANEKETLKDQRDLWHEEWTKVTETARILKEKLILIEAEHHPIEEGSYEGHFFHVCSCQMSGCKVIDILFPLKEDHTDA